MIISNFPDYAALPLTVKKAPGKTPHIPPEVREKLIKKLQEPEGETSYGKLQIWLEKECGSKVSYKVVHDPVHYKLKSYIKVPRTQSNKVNEVAQTNFNKKTVGDYQSND
jgi:hypothetical protein